MTLSRVIHPLDDIPETKRSSEGVGRIKLTRSVRVSLIVLRAYLIGMTMLLLFHVFQLAGIFRAFHL